MDFSHYIALGDSMSIDLYPALDAGEIDVAVALERDATAGRVAALGAASLFYRNDEGRWPEEIGNDLVSRFPAIEFANFAMDGATIGDVFGEQLPQLIESEEPTLLTLTIGATDLFSAFTNRPKTALLDRIVHLVPGRSRLRSNPSSKSTPTLLCGQTSLGHRSGRPMPGPRQPPRRSQRCRPLPPLQRRRLSLQLRHLPLPT